MIELKQNEVDIYCKCGNTLKFKVIPNLSKNVIIIESCEICSKVLTTIPSMELKKGINFTPRYMVNEPS